MDDGVESGDEVGDGRSHGVADFADGAHDEGAVGDGGVSLLQLGEDRRQEDAEMGEEGLTPGCLGQLGNHFPGALDQHLVVLGLLILFAHLVIFRVLTLASSFALLFQR